ncbi:MAG: hypothetical protein KAI66_07750 [Lentisphaeria bacterium]|nr:hypothetical protein [Lentisphaeria bacterium]
MKYIGYVFAIVLGLVFVLMHNTEAKKLAKCRQEIDTFLAGERGDAKAILDREDEKIERLRVRWADETRKTERLRAQVISSESRRDSLKGTIDNLTISTEKLQEVKDTTSDKQKLNMEDIQELQARITKGEHHVEYWKLLIGMVTEKSEVD